MCSYMTKKVTLSMEQHGQAMEKTLSIEVNNGILVCLKMYYENGEMATYSTLQQRTYYDKDGNVISETDFRAGIDSETLSRMRMASMELEKR